MGSDPETVNRPISLHNPMQSVELELETWFQLSPTEREDMTLEEAFGDEGLKWLTVMRHVASRELPAAARAMGSDLTWSSVTFGLRQWNAITERVATAIDDRWNAWDRPGFGGDGLSPVLWSRDT